MGSGQEDVDYYSILEIRDPEKANDDLIKQSYKRMSLKTHPDKNRDDPTATARFQLVQDARDTLLDSQKRRIYDAMRKARSSKAQGAGESNENGYQETSTWFWIFVNLHRPDPRAFSTPGARVPCETRPQRAKDLRKAAEGWQDGERTKHEDLGKMREDMRAKQKEENQRAAREKEKAKARQQENEKKAWENQQQQAREKVDRDLAAPSAGHPKASRIFHNLPGSNCEHRGQWDMVRKPLTCQCCCRFMSDATFSRFPASVRNYNKGSSTIVRRSFPIQPQLWQMVTVIRFEVAKTPALSPGTPAQLSL
ncbi:DnaJ domain-containing protein [Camillea tinctor]|nr:DnaJ domain-containing protein [Camillea tinctor]